MSDERTIAMNALRDCLPRDYTRLFEDKGYGENKNARIPRIAKEYIEAIEWRLKYLEGFKYRADVFVEHMNSVQLAFLALPVDFAAVGIDVNKKKDRLTSMLKGINGEWTSLSVCHKQHLQEYLAGRNKMIEKYASKISEMREKLGKKGDFLTGAKVASRGLSALFEDLPKDACRLKDIYVKQMAVCPDKLPGL